jgi:type I restriction enzyme M protein
VLKAWLKLCDRQTALKKGIKEAEEALDLRVYERYRGLSEAEVKALVVEDKWLSGAEASGRLLTRNYLDA